MPRRPFNEEEKQYIRDNATICVLALAEILMVDPGAIYQLAVDERFSVKKGGKQNKHNKRIELMVRACSTWPKKYYRYKKMLVERDGLRCHYCDYLMSYEEAQVDHILAKARGGTDAPHNLVLACSRCNNLKSTLCYECPEFRNAISS